MSDDKTTHFGYREVPVGDKASLVRGVFDSVAQRYDLMNDLMSAGAHRLWKRFAINAARLRAGERVLDLAGGTGDLAARISPRVGADGLVVLSDLNEAMLRNGRDRLSNEGLVGNTASVLADAQALPFADNSFDCVTMAFGLRNVTDKSLALSAIHRVLRPGGRMLVLEFSRPVAPGLKPVYDLYSFAVLPAMGKLVANDSESYRYLAESIRMHPDQQGLLAMMCEAGFERCSYNNLSGGVVALHQGYKL